MKCPKCARTIRSKTHCAYCGATFNLETSESEKVVPKTKPKKRPNRVFPVVMGIVKIVALIMTLLLAFLYVPRFFSQLMNGGSKQEVAVQPSSAVVPVSVEESSVSVTFETSSEQVTTQSIEEAKPELTLLDKQVNLDHYPIVEVTLTFEQLLEEAGRETFEFAIKENGASRELTDYVLEKDDKTLHLMFTDTQADFTKKEQTLEIFAPELNFTNVYSYDLPESPLDDEAMVKFREAIAPLDNEKTSIAFAQVGKAPVYTNAERVEASMLLSWFILQDVYSTIEQGQLTFDTEVSIEEALKATGEQSETSLLEEGEVVTVQALLTRMIQNQDVTAMNHLIQALGGANTFNQWLKQQGYVGTAINQTLFVENNSVKGATTTAADVMRLLSQFGKGNLLAEEYTSQLKEALLQTPETAKYPTNLSIVKKRYEITTADSDGQHQYYSGLLTTEDGAYIVVILTEAGQVDSIANVLANLMQGDAREVVSSIEEVQQETERETITTPATNTTNTGTTTTVTPPTTNTNNNSTSTSTTPPPASSSEASIEPSVSESTDELSLPSISGIEESVPAPEAPEASSSAE